MVFSKTIANCDGIIDTVECFHGIFNLIEIFNGFLIEKPLKSMVIVRV